VLTIVVVTVLAVRVLDSPPYVQGGLLQRACKVATAVAEAVNGMREVGVILAAAVGVAIAPADGSPELRQGAMGRRGQRRASRRLKSMLGECV